MKLKTRLVVAFVTITLMPIFLIYMVAVGLSSYQTKAFSEEYGLTEQIDLLSGNSVQAFNRLTRGFEEKLQKAVDESPEKFENPAYLAELNKELKNYYAYLIVRKGDQILFTGDEDLSIDKDILTQLPEYGNGQHRIEGSCIWTERVSIWSGNWIFLSGTAIRAAFLWYLRWTNFCQR